MPPGRLGCDGAELPPRTLSEWRDLGGARDYTTVDGN